MLVLVDHDQCKYLFEWPTAVVCKSSTTIPDTGCKFVDKAANVSFDLSVLTANGNDVQVRCNVCIESNCLLCAMSFVF